MAYLIALIGVRGNEFLLCPNRRGDRIVVVPSNTVIVASKRGQLKHTCLLRDGGGGERTRFRRSQKYAGRANKIFVQIWVGEWTTNILFFSNSGGASELDLKAIRGLTRSHFIEPAINLVKRGKIRLTRFLPPCIRGYSNTNKKYKRDPLLNVQFFNRLF